MTGQQARWALHCKLCAWEPDGKLTMEEVRDDHFIVEHKTDQVAFDLVPHCPVDDAPLDLSESADSGQCPTCGYFEILRLPEQYR